MFDLLKQPNWQTNPNGAVSLQITNPAAGADISYTVPAGTRLILLSLAGVLTTDANPANRAVRFSFNDGASGTTNIFNRTAQSGNLTASKTQLILLSGNGPNTTVDGGITSLILTPLILLPGYHIVSVTTNVQVGDQWSALWMQCIQQTH